MIDTSVLIDLERAFRQDLPASLDRLPPDSVMSAVTFGELQFGLLRAETDIQRRAATGFISLVGARLPIIPFGENEAETWARIFDALRRRGQLFGERDMQIAATAVAGGHSVMTGNRREFERVPGLTILDPPSV